MRLVGDYVTPEWNMHIMEPVPLRVASECARRSPASTDGALCERNLTCTETRRCGVGVVRRSGCAAGACA